ncbi:MAG: hypothetical protein WAT23_19205, partial [Chromatiaceae bacterium]
AQKGRALLEAKTADATEPDTLARLTEQLQHLETREEKARRRAARFAAKAKAAKDEALAQGLLPAQQEGDTGDRRQ